MFLALSNRIVHVHSYHREHDCAAYAFLPGFLLANLLPALTHLNNVPTHRLADAGFGHKNRQHQCRLTALATLYYAVHPK